MFSFSCFSLAVLDIRVSAKSVLDISAKSAKCGSNTDLASLQKLHQQQQQWELTAFPNTRLIFLRNSFQE